MARVLYALAGVAIVLLLLQATLQTTSTPLGDDRQDWTEATSECHRSLRDSIADARFPFPPSIDQTPGSDAGVELSGTMDSGSGPNIERQNYVCYLSSDAEPGPYVTDSVYIWKSH